jgi:Putative zinc-finger
MNCEQAQEWITALVDDELSAEERHAIDTHLAACHQCRQVYEQERRIKEQVRLASTAITAPAALRRIIDGSIAKASGWQRINARLKDLLTMPWVRPALAVALLLLVLYPLMFRRAGNREVALATLTTYAEIEAGNKTLPRVDNPEELKRNLVQSVGGRFAPMGFDLSMMKLYPVSGFMEQIGGRKVLVTVYRGEGPDVTCFTFLGSESDTPPDAKRLFDEAKKINFYTFAQGDIHAVMHREGEVICIMVSKMPAPQLLALMRDKARPT